MYSRRHFVKRMIKYCDYFHRFVLNKSVAIWLWPPVCCDLLHTLRVNNSNIVMTEIRKQGNRDFLARIWPHSAWGISIWQSTSVFRNPQFSQPSITNHDHPRCSVQAPYETCLSNTDMLPISCLVHKTIKDHFCSFSRQILVAYVSLNFVSLMQDMVLQSVFIIKSNEWSWKINTDLFCGYFIEIRMPFAQRSLAIRSNF